MSWSSIELANVVDVAAGQPAPPKDAFEDVGTPFIRAGSVESLMTRANWSELEHLSESAARERGMKLFPANTVLFAKSGMSASLGRVFKTDRPAFVVSHLAALKPTGKADPSFLSHWLSYFGTSRLIKDSAYPSIRLADIKEMPFPDVALSEQQRIAAILDQADALRRLRRQSLSRLSDLGQAIFFDMFGDPARNPHKFNAHPLGEIATKFSDGPFGSNLKSSHYVDEGVRVIRLQNIGVDEFVDKDKAYISEEHFASLQKHECLPGDVLVGTLGDPNLRACIQPDWLPLALNKADCVQIRVDRSVASNEYICALLNLPSVERMAQNLVLGQTRARISMGRLKKLRVPIPPKDRQDKFASIVGQLRMKGQLFEKSLGESDRLFTSLQHRAFCGELWRMSSQSTKHFPKLEQAR